MTLLISLFAIKRLARLNVFKYRKLIFYEKEIDDDVEILNKIKIFYETAFQSQSSKTVSELVKIFCAIATPSLNSFMTETVVI